MVMMMMTENLYKRYICARPIIYLAMIFGVHLDH